MKKYIILCKEVTGVSGKILTNGNTYDASEFVPACIDDFIKSGHIKDATEVVKSDPTVAPANGNDSTADGTIDEVSPTTKTKQTKEDTTVKP